MNAAGGDEKSRARGARLAFHQGGVSLKEAAFRVGYNHVTNFINAFRARFGAPPGRFLTATRANRKPRTPRRRAAHR